MPNVVITGRFTGGALFSPKKVDEAKPPKYSALLVLDEGEIDKLRAAVKTVITDKWAGKMPPGCQNFVERKGDDPEFLSFENYYINAKANGTDKSGAPSKGPGVFIRRDGALHAVTAADDIVYPGCYVAMEVSVYGQDGDKTKNIKPCITVGLEKVLFKKDGERLSNQTSPEDAFSGYTSEEKADAGVW